MGFALSEDDEGRAKETVVKPKGARTYCANWCWREKKKNNQRMRLKQRIYGGALEGGHPVNLLRHCSLRGVDES